MISRKPKHDSIWTVFDLGTGEMWWFDSRASAEAWKKGNGQKSLSKVVKYSKDY